MPLISQAPPTPTPPEPEHPHTTTTQLADNKHQRFTVASIATVAKSITIPTTMPPKRKPQKQQQQQMLLKSAPQNTTPIIIIISTPFPPNYVLLMIELYSPTLILHNTLCRNHTYTFTQSDTQYSSHTILHIYKIYTIYTAACRRRALDYFFGFFFLDSRALCKTGNPCY